MKNILTAFLLTASISTFSQTAEKNFIDQNYIEVTGVAEMEITPDLIYVDIVLSENDNKNKISLPETESKMIGKLKEIGIDVTKDLSVRDFTSSFKDYWISKTDVMLTKEYQLLLHDAKMLQKVFTQPKDLGISNLSINRFDHTKIEQFRKEVKVNAIKAAKEKAQFLTLAVDQTIGKAIFIQELNPGNIINQINERNANVLYMYKNAVGDESEPDLSVDKIKLKYSILVRFELK
jgi:uncharacterized protein